MKENQEFNGLLLTNLAKIKRWTKFLSIVCYVLMALMILFTIIMGVFGSTIGSLESFAAAGPIFSLIYLGGAALYYFSAKYLGDISKSADMAHYTSETTHIESLIAAVAKLFSLYGIITAVVLAIYLLIFIVGILFGVASLG